jgi:hypothetical protein
MDIPPGAAPNPNTCRPLPDEIPKNVFRNNFLTHKSTPTFFTTFCQAGEPSHNMSSIAGPNS